MVKGQKSSASANTRKKHALKAAGPVQPEPLPKEKKGKKEKGKNKEPPRKMFIAPVKPAPVRADPLDYLGLGALLPPELYVILRKLGKKDEVTRGKALEELQTSWLDKCKEGEDITLISSLIAMLPVWVRRVTISSTIA